MGARIAELPRWQCWATEKWWCDGCQQQEGSHLHSVQSGSGAHLVGTDGAFPGSKVVSAWLWPLTSMEYQG